MNICVETRLSIVNKNSVLTKHCYDYYMYGYFDIAEKYSNHGTTLKVGGRGGLTSDSKSSGGGGGAQ